MRLAIVVAMLVVGCGPTRMTCDTSNPALSPYRCGDRVIDPGFIGAACRAPTCVTGAAVCQDSHTRDPMAPFDRLACDGHGVVLDGPYRAGEP